jgi:hypothetical protein
MASTKTARTNKPPKIEAKSVTKEKKLSVSYSTIPIGLKRFWRNIPGYYGLLVFRKC